MFTGLVTHTGKILSVGKKGDLRVAVSCPWKDIAVGESVAVNGVCLTVVGRGIRDSGLGIKKKKITIPNPQPPIPNAYFTADVSAETVKRTAPRWKAGETVNLERSLKIGDDIGGHFVTGHVDGVAELKEIRKKGGSHQLCIKAPKELAKFIAPKGSVSLDGVSLTVNKVEGRMFWVNIIPHTWKATTLGRRKAGDRLNLEIDVIARYVARMVGKKK